MTCINKKLHVSFAKKGRGAMLILHGHQNCAVHQPILDNGRNVHIVSNMLRNL